jgi:hypothetical protein
VTNYYVYYKVELVRFAEMRGAVEKLFGIVEREAGVRGRSMQRRDDPTTWMEVYEGVRDTAAFDALLEREAPAFGVARKVERFICA